MKAKEFTELLKTIEDRTFVGNELIIHGAGEFGTEEERREINLSDKQVILLSEALQKNSTINKIDLSGNTIFDEGAIALAGIKGIENLDLSGNMIGPVGAKALGESNVKILSLEDNALSIVGYGEQERPKFLEMVEAFIKNKTIVELNLVSAEIPNEMLAQLIGKNTTIKSLFLSRYLSDKVFEFIKDNETLEEIYILKCSYRKITDKTIEYIAQNNHLKKLYIDNSDITNVGVKILSTHPSLESISLYDSNMTFEGALALLYSTTLQDISINTNLKQHIMSQEECTTVARLFYEPESFLENPEHELEQNQDCEPKMMDCEEEEETIKTFVTTTKEIVEKINTSEDSMMLSSSSYSDDHTYDIDALKVTGNSNETESDFS